MAKAHSHTIDSFNKLLEDLDKIVEKSDQTNPPLEFIAEDLNKIGVTLTSDIEEAEAQQAQEAKVAIETEALVEDLVEKYAENLEQQFADMQKKLVLNYRLQLHQLINRKNKI